jgi:hypothetical protein
VTGTAAGRVDNTRGVTRTAARAVRTATGRREKVCIYELVGALSAQKILVPQMKNLQITKKIGSANHKTVKRHICGRYANITNYLGLQICGFADHPPLLFGITFRLSVS